MVSIIVAADQTAINLPNPRSCFIFLVQTHLIRARTTHRALKRGTVTLERNTITLGRGTVTVKRGS